MEEDHQQDAALCPIEDPGEDDRESDDKHRKDEVEERPLIVDREMKETPDRTEAYRSGDCIEPGLELWEGKASPADFFAQINHKDRRKQREGPRLYGTVKAEEGKDSDAAEP